VSILEKKIILESYLLRNNKGSFGSLFFYHASMEFRKKTQKKPMYVPWFPAVENADFVTYIHQGLHHVIGEDVGFPYSSWSYMQESSPFQIQDRSDSALHYQVMDAIYKSREIDGSRVSILVHNGIVNLFGFVLKDQDRLTIEKIVRSIKEVWSVENEIVVQGTDDFKRTGHVQ
jgi:BON domain